MQSVDAENVRIHRQRSDYNMPGTNSFSSQIKMLKNFQSNNLDHMIVNSPCIKKPYEKSFSQFFLLSASSKDVSVNEFSRPFFINLSMSLIVILSAHLSLNQCLLQKKFLRFAFHLEYDFALSQDALKT